MSDAHDRLLEIRNLEDKARRLAFDEFEWMAEEGHEFTPETFQSVFRRHCGIIVRNNKKIEEQRAMIHAAMKEQCEGDA